MKKRYLKPTIQNALLTITGMLIIPLACLEDFNLRGVPVIIGIILTLLFNVTVLTKYGRI